MEMNGAGKPDAVPTIALRILTYHFEDGKGAVSIPAHATFAEVRLTQFVSAQPL